MSMVVFVDTAAEAVAEDRGRRHRADRRLRCGGPAGRADRGADRERRPRPHRRQQQRRQRRPRPGRADPRGPGAQDHLLVPAAARLVATSTQKYRAGRIELELVPQGNLAERIRAAGAGIGGVLHAHRLRHAARRGQGGPRDRRPPLRPGATRSAPTSHWSPRRPPTRLGNLVYRKTARNFGPIMAAAADDDRRPGARAACRSAASTPSTSSRPGCTSTAWCTCRRPAPAPSLEEGQ